MVIFPFLRLELNRFPIRRKRPTFPGASAIFRNLHDSVNLFRPVASGPSADQLAVK